MRYTPVTHRWWLRDYALAVACMLAVQWSCDDVGASALLLAVPVAMILRRVG